MYKDKFKRDTTFKLSNGSHLELHDYRDATKEELIGLIKRKKGFLKGVYLDRESFLNLLELKEQGVQYSLRGANLSGINLSPLFYYDKKESKQVAAITVIRGLDLSGAILNNADLSGVLFDKCDLKGAAFRKANLDKATFAKCDVSSAIFPGVLSPKQVYTSTGRTKAFYGSEANNKNMVAGFVALRSEAEQRQKSPNKYTLTKLKADVKRFFDSGRAVVRPHLYVNILAVRNEDRLSLAAHKTRDNEFKSKQTRSVSSKHSPVASGSHLPTPAMPNPSKLSHQIPAHLKEAVKEAQMQFANKGRKIRSHQENLVRRRESRKTAVNSGRTD